MIYLHNRQSHFSEKKWTLTNETTWINLFRIIILSRKDISKDSIQSESSLCGVQNWALNSILLRNMRTSILKMKNQGNEKHNNSQESSDSLLLKVTNNMMKKKTSTVLVKKNSWMFALLSWFIMDILHTFENVKQEFSRGWVSILVTRVLVYHTQSPRIDSSPHHINRAKCTCLQSEHSRSKDELQVICGCVANLRPSSNS